MAQRDPALFLAGMCPGADTPGDDRYCRPVFRRSRSTFAGEGIDAAFGEVYLGAMIARLVLGMSILWGDSWFGRPLPRIFHLAPASFVITLGWNRRRAYKFSHLRDDC